MSYRRTDVDRYEAEFIRFDPVPPITSADKRRVTKVWQVKTLDDFHVLGIVSWFTAWRRYVFKPYPNRVFEQDCLRTIAQYIVDRTVEQRTRGK